MLISFNDFDRVLANQHFDNTFPELDRSVSHVLAPDRFFEVMKTIARIRAGDRLDPLMTEFEQELKTRRLDIKNRILKAWNITLPDTKRLEEDDGLRVFVFEERFTTAYARSSLFSPHELFLGTSLLVPAWTAKNLRFMAWDKRPHTENALDQEVHNQFAVVINNSLAEMDEEQANALIVREAVYLKWHHAKCRAVFTRILQFFFPVTCALATLTMLSLVASEQGRTLCNVASYIGTLVAVYLFVATTQFFYKQYVYYLDRQTAEKGYRDGLLRYFTQMSAQRKWLEGRLEASPLHLKRMFHHFLRVHEQIPSSEDRMGALIRSVKSVSASSRISSSSAGTRRRWAYARDNVSHGNSARVFRSRR